jgi:sRNA-binding regulator protein Hfq
MSVPSTVKTERDFIESSIWLIGIIGVSTIWMFTIAIILGSVNYTTVLNSNQCTYENCAATSSRCKIKDCEGNQCKIVKDTSDFGCCENGEICNTTTTLSNYAFNSICYQHISQCASVTSMEIQSALESRTSNELIEDTVEDNHPPYSYYSMLKKIPYYFTMRDSSGSNKVTLDISSANGVVSIDLSNITISYDNYPVYLKPHANLRMIYKPIENFFYSWETVNHKTDDGFKMIATCSVDDHLRILIERPNGLKKGQIYSYSQHVIQYPIEQLL